MAEAEWSSLRRKQFEHLLLLKMFGANFLHSTLAMAVVICSCLVRGETGPGPCTTDTTQPVLTSALTRAARRGELWAERGPARPSLACLPSPVAGLDTLSYNWTFPPSHGQPYRKPSSIPMESCDPADRSWQSHLPSGHQGHTCPPRHFPTREIIMTTLASQLFYKQVGAPSVARADPLTSAITIINLQTKTEGAECDPTNYN